jgi:hypothetical protein
MTPDIIETGMRVHHLIYLLESLYHKPPQTRDQWWLMRFTNLLKTLEYHTKKRYPKLHQERINTEQRIDLI